MSRKGDSSVPYIFNDEDMQTTFHKNFFIRPIVRGTSFHLENFTTLPQVFVAFKFQCWNDFLRISKDIYIGLVFAFYNTLAPIDKDNTSLQTIIWSFKIQVLPFDIAQITNTPNKGILCRGGAKWWEEQGATKDEVAAILIGNHHMQVREIRTSHLLILDRVVYSVVQNIVLPRIGNTDVMTEADQMVMFYHMTRRKINLVRSILDFILSAIDIARRSHTALPYGMFLTRVFIRAQLPLDGHRIDNQCPTITMKIVSTLGLKS